MHDMEIIKALYENLDTQGYQGKVISIGRVKELEAEIMAHRQSGLLDDELYDDYLASFDFECHKKLADAQSLIIVSVPQPQVRVSFEVENHSHALIIPPTYGHSIDQHVAKFLDSFLSPNGYHFKKVRLPEKLLAVRSGLAKYGKNNITYLPEVGSFHRPMVFISDLPCRNDSWGEATLLDQCENCSACMNACPSGAIGSDRFLLHAERCLTFFNERAVDFPDWLSPAWHNSLVGCMICQKVCPANKGVVKWIEGGTAFDNIETDHILNGVPDDKLSPATLEKINNLGMSEYYNVLGRNMKLIIEAPCQGWH
jgi:epoxyqueuosine reductase